MKVGDLVTYWHKKAQQDITHVGIVVEIGKFAGGYDTLVSWMGKRKAEVRTEVSQHLALVDNICLTSS